MAAYFLIKFYSLFFCFFQVGFPIFCIYYFLKSSQETSPTLKGGLTSSGKKSQTSFDGSQDKKDLLLRGEKK